jgi:hypothetical protein
VFRKQSNDSSSALWASYYDAHLLAKENEPFLWRICKKMFQYTVKGISLDKVTFNTATLSLGTMT